MFLSLRKRFALTCSTRSSCYGNRPWYFCLETNLRFPTCAPDEASFRHTVRRRSNSFSRCSPTVINGVACCAGGQCASCQTWIALTLGHQLWQTTLLREIAEQPDCLRLASLLQSRGKCVRKCLQVLASRACLELEQRFADCRVNALLVQHARNMRRPSRQFHLATVQALDVVRRPFRFSRHIDTPVLRQRLSRRLINAGERVVARQSAPGIQE